MGPHQYHRQQEANVRNRHAAEVMYLVAALCFLIAGIVGLIADAEARVAGGAFLVLSAAFAILAFNARKARRSNTSNHRTST